MNAADSSGDWTAFSRDSIRTGAVVSFSGDTFVVSGAQIISEIESQFSDPASWPELRDRWLMKGVPILSRGDAWVVALTWEPPLPDADATERRELSARSDELWMAVRSVCSHRYGNQIGVDLSARTGRATGYAAALLRTGARRADWWASGQSAVVLVVYGDSLPAPKSATALHVVPIGWVSERRPTRKLPRIDVEWSWVDVVALYAASTRAETSETRAETSEVADRHGDRRL